MQPVQPAQLVQPVQLEQTTSQVSQPPVEAASAGGSVGHGGHGFARMRRELQPARSRPSMLMAQLQVAPLLNGALAAPNGTEYVFMEIGTSDAYTADDEVLPHEPAAFLISFEPLLDKARPLRRSHACQPRLLATPASYAYSPATLVTSHACHGSLDHCKVVHSPS